MRRPRAGRRRRCPRPPAGRPEPAQSGASGPTTTRSIACSRQNATNRSKSMGSSATQVASFSMPAFPGAHQSAPSSGDAASCQQRACSRPPEPTTKTFIQASPHRLIVRATIHARASAGPLFSKGISYEFGHSCRLTVGRLVTRMRHLLADGACRCASGCPLLSLEIERVSDVSAQAGGGEAAQFRLSGSTCTRRTSC